MSRRTEKVESLLQQTLGDMLERIDLPSMTTISKVEVSPDLKHAKVWITVLEGESKEQQVLDFLANELYGLQGELNRKFTMRNVPRISFFVDHSEEYASHINELLRKTKREDE
ncbi:MAG: 30S ribosome-binding factor RbfA [Candidatus Saccharibacteria bacterium]